MGQKVVIVFGVGTWPIHCRKSRIEGTFFTDRAIYFSDFHLVLPQSTVVVAWWRAGEAGFLCPELPWSTEGRRWDWCFHRLEFEPFFTVSDFPDFVFKISSSIFKLLVSVFQISSPESAGFGFGHPQRHWTEQKLAKKWLI